MELGRRPRGRQRISEPPQGQRGPQAIRGEVRYHQLRTIALNDFSKKRRMLKEESIPNSIITVKGKTVPSCNLTRYYAPRGGTQANAPRGGTQAYAPRGGTQANAPRGGTQGNAPKSGTLGNAPRGGTQDNVSPPFMEKCIPALNQRGIDSRRHHNGPVFKKTSARNYTRE